MSTVSTVASHSAEFPPEFARVSVRLSAAEGSRERVVDQVATANRTLEGWLRGVAGVVLTSPTLSTHPIRERRGRYSAELARWVEFHDPALEAMADVLDRAATELAATLDGPSWGLSPETHRRHHREVTQVAVSLAREQADAFAEALGLRVGELVSIGDHSSGPSRGLAMAFGHGRSAAGLGEVDFTPAAVTIQATAEATWQLVP